MAENKVKSLQGLPKLNRAGGGLPKLGGLKKPAPKETAKSDADAKDATGNSSISTDTKAVSADTKAISADTKAVSADTKAVSVDTKAVSADTKAVSADTKAISADTKAVSDGGKLSFLNDSAANDASELLDAVGGIDGWELPDTSSGSTRTVGDGSDANAKDAETPSASAPAKGIEPPKPIAPPKAADPIAPPKPIEPPKATEPEPPKADEPETPEAAKLTHESVMEKSLESMLLEQTELGSSIMPTIDGVMASAILDKPVEPAKPAPAPGSPLSANGADAADLSIAGVKRVAVDRTKRNFERARELTDEEQLEALLASMTPEERAEYDAYCKEQERLQMQSMPKKKPIGLIIAIAIVLCIGGGVAAFVAMSGEEPAPVPEPVVEVPPEPVAPVIQRVDLATYPVILHTNDASHVYINGVEQQPDGPFSFVEGHTNTILAYRDGNVPYFQSFSEKTDDPISIEFESDLLYAKGELTLRFQAKTMANDAKTVVKLDGVPVDKPGDPMQNVVLGRPHVITVEHPDYAPHLAIVIPDDSSNRITIPELVKPDDAKAGTKCTMKKMDNKSRITMKTSSESFNSATELVAAPGDMIEYGVTREQRFPLQLGVMPEGFGSVSLVASLLHDSIGKATVSFILPKKSTIEICFRRSGEVICPDMKGETMIPSGLAWEMFGTDMRDGTRKPMIGSQIQDLLSQTRYVFNISQDKRGGVVISIKEESKIKDESKNSKSKK